MTSIRFLPESVTRLYRTVEHRVDTYFETHGLNRYATPAAVAKTTFFTLLFGLTYGFLLLVALPLGVFLLLWFFMGAFLMRAAMSIVHDAARGISFTPRPWVRAVLRRGAHLVDGHGFWDCHEQALRAPPAAGEPDASPYILVHVTPFTTTRNGQLYQRRYMRALYPFYVLFWALFQDFKYYEREKNKHFYAHHPAVHWVGAFVSKAYYLFYLLVVPAQVLPVPFWHIALGFGCMHLGTGVVALFALLAREPLQGPELVVPNADGAIDYRWGQHPVPVAYDSDPHAGLLIATPPAEGLLPDPGQTSPTPAPQPRAAARRQPPVATPHA